MIMRGAGGISRSHREFWKAALHDLGQTGWGIQYRQTAWRTRSSTPAGSSEGLIVARQKDDSRTEIEECPVG
jgi:hypothetical protein